MSMVSAVFSSKRGYRQAYGHDCNVIFEEQFFLMITLKKVRHYVQKRRLLVGKYLY